MRVNYELCCPKINVLITNVKRNKKSFKEVGNIFFFSIQQTLIISLNHIHRDQAHQPIDLIIQLNLTGDLKKLFSVKSEHNFIAVGEVEQSRSSLCGFFLFW